MKKTLSVILVCVLMLGVLASLVSCGGLSGTYEGTLCTLKFSGSKVTVSIGEDSVEGTYKITEKDNGSKTISFDFVESDEDDKVLATIDKLLQGEVPFEKDGDVITIARVFKFTKK